MSNIYLYNNRIIKEKDVDKELKKIGTGREDISSKELIALIISILLLLGALDYGIYYKKHHKPEIKNNATEIAMYNATQYKLR